MRQIGDWNYVGLVEKMETISPKSKSIAQPLTKNDLQKIVLAIFRRVPAGEGMSGVTPQTWNLSKNLHDPIFGRKNFTH